MRVLRVTFKPGENADTHHHPDHMVFVLKGGELDITSKAKTEKTKLKEEQVIFFDELDHAVKNNGKSTVDLLVVELKK